MSATGSQMATSGNTETGAKTSGTAETGGTGGTNGTGGTGGLDETTGTEGPGEGGFEPQDVDRVLLMGFDPDANTQLGAVAEQLEMLLRTENADAVVLGHNAAGTMLHQSFWSAQHHAGTLDVLDMDSWDSVVIVGQRSQAGSYPEFYYNGVSPLAQAVVDQGGIPVVYAHRGEIETELGYRVGRGTSSQVAPIGSVLDELADVEAFASSSEPNKHAIAAAMSLYVFYTKKNPAELPSDTLAAGGDLLGSIGDHVNDSVYAEMSTTHYEGPYSGVVKLATDAVPEASDVGYFWAGTSTESGWNQAFGALLNNSGYGPLSERVAHGDGRTLGDAGAAEAVETMDASKETYYLALARNWEDSANDLLDSYDVQCMIYSKFEPGNGVPADAESISNNLLQPFMVVSKYPLSGVTNRTYLPLFAGVARYYDQYPDVVFSNDGTHMTGPFRNLLASMSFTAFHNEMATTDGLDEDTTAAVEIGHEIVRQFAHLSDSGEHVADFAGNPL